MYTISAVKLIFTESLVVYLLLNGQFCIGFDFDYHFGILRLSFWCLETAPDFI